MENEEAVGPDSSRPGFVVFLAVIHVLGVGAMLIGEFFGNSARGTWMLEGASRWGLIAGVAAILLAGSWGLWRGRQWGWWLLATYYLSAFLSRGLTFAFALESLGLRESGLPILARSAGRAFMSLAILAVMHGPRLSAFAGVQGPILKRLGLLLAVTLTWNLLLILVGSVLG